MRPHIGAPQLEVYLSWLEALLAYYLEFRLCVLRLVEVISTCKVPIWMVIYAYL